MKLGGVVVVDPRGLDVRLPPSPSLRLPVPSMRKRPGKRPRRLRPLRAAVPGEKDRKGPGKIDREGAAYKRDARIVTRVGGVVVVALRGLVRRLPLPSSLRLPVPSMGKRPGKRPRRLRPLRPAVLGEKDRKGPGKIDKEGEAYRRIARIVMKLGGGLVYDLRGLDIELPPSPYLRLPAPSMRKRPGKRPRRPRRRRPIAPAVLGQKDREGPGEGRSRPESL